MTTTGLLAAIAVVVFTWAWVWWHTRHGGTVQFICNCCGREVRRMTAEEAVELSTEEAFSLIRCEECLDAAAGRGVPEPYGARRGASELDPSSPPASEAALMEARQRRGEGSTNAQEPEAYRNRRPGVSRGLQILMAGLLSGAVVGFVAASLVAG